MRTLSTTLQSAQEDPSIFPIISLVLTHGEDEYTYDTDRILGIEHPEMDDSHKLTVILDNADDALTDLDLKGFDAVISYGAVTTEGDEDSPCAPLKVVRQRFHSEEDKPLTCTLICIGIPDRLKRDKASDEYSHHESSTKTVKDLITEIADGQPVSETLTEKQETTDGYIALDDSLHVAGQRLSVDARTITKISFKLKKTGSPTGDVTFRIYDVAEDSIVATKVLGNASSLTTSPVWYEATLDTPYVADSEMIWNDSEDVKAWIGGYLLYVEFTNGDASNYVQVQYSSADVKAKEWAVKYSPTQAPGDSGTEYEGADCVYRYKYTGDGIGVFSHCTSYTVTYDSEDSLIDVFEPQDSFIIYQGDDRLSVIDKLLYYTGCERRFEDDGEIHVFVPNSTAVLKSYTLTIRPNATGDEANLTDYPSAGDNYEKVDEETLDINDYVGTNNAAYLRDLYNLESHSDEAGTIGYVKVYAKARKGSMAGVSQCAKLVIKSGTGEGAPDTVTEGEEETLTYYLGTGSEQWSTNPATGSAWTWDEIDNLQAGIALKRDNNNYPSYCYQLYVEVVYYSYNSEYSLESGHTFFGKSLLKGLVLPNKITVESQPNHANQYTGNATSAASYALLPVEDFIRTKLASNAQAASIAAATISHLEINTQNGAATVPMNCGAELYDYVLVTDEREDDTKAGNIGFIVRYYRPGYYRMYFGFGGIGVKSVPGTKLSDFLDPTFGMDPDTNVKWGQILPMFEQIVSLLQGVKTFISKLLGEDSTGDQIDDSLLTYYTKSQVDNLVANEKFYPAVFSDQSMDSYSNYAVALSISGNAAFISGRVPWNFNSIASAEVLFYPEVNDATADIDIITKYAAEGEAYNTHQDIDDSSTYNLTGDQLFALDVSGLLTNLAAGDNFGIEVKNNEANFAYVLGFRLRYN